MRQHIERWLGLLGSGLLENWQDDQAIEAARQRMSAFGRQLARLEAARDG